MGLGEKASHARKVMALLVRHPGQVRHVPQWLRRVHEPTIESGLPWLPFDVIERLDREVCADSRVFEYGGGGSTIWFARRAGEVVTVEHDDSWFAELQRRCAQPHVRLLHRSDPHDAAYIAAANEVGGGWDVIVVDGRERIQCLRAAMQAVKPGGLVVLDDTDRRRYQYAFQLLAGWDEVTYRGLAPMKPLPGQTTIWRRP